MRDLLPIDKDDRPEARRKRKIKPMKKAVLIKEMPIFYEDKNGHRVYDFDRFLFDLEMEIKIHTQQKIKLDISKY